MILAMSRPMIARLLGHSRVETTARCVRLARDLAHEIAARLAVSIREDLLSVQDNGGASPAGRLSQIRLRSSEARA